MVLKIEVLSSFFLLPDHFFHSSAEIPHILLVQADKHLSLIRFHAEQRIILQFYDRPYLLLNKLSALLRQKNLLVPACSFFQIQDALFLKIAHRRIDRLLARERFPADISLETSVAQHTDCVQDRTCAV